MLIFSTRVFFINLSNDQKTGLLQEDIFFTVPIHQSVQPIILSYWSMKNVGEITRCLNSKLTSHLGLKQLFEILYKNG